MSSDMGKKFEKIIFDGFNALPNVSIDRIPDQTMHFKDRKNVSDFIVFRIPFEYYVECKTVHGNRLPFKNITQFDKLLEKSRIAGVKAGILCWWVDKDVTRWLPIEKLEIYRAGDAKSFRYDDPLTGAKTIKGRKKKVFFEYDLSSFFEED